MNGRRPYLALGFILAWLLTMQLAYASCDKRPVVPERVELIGRDMLVNGLETTVTALTMRGTPETVSAAFREFWVQEGAPAKGRPQAAGLALSAIDGECFYLLQLPRHSVNGTVKGIFSATSLRGSRQNRVRATDIALPDSIRTMADVESRDFRQVGRTWVLDVPGRGRDSASAYKQKLVEQGWRVISDTPAYALDGTAAVNGYALAMQRGNDRLDAVFSGNGSMSSRAVVNVSRSL